MGTIGENGSTRNIFQNFFDVVVEGFEKLCCCLCEPGPPTESPYEVIEAARRSTESSTSTRSSTRSRVRNTAAEFRGSQRRQPHTDARIRQETRAYAVAQLIREDEEFARRLQAKEYDDVTKKIPPQIRPQKVVNQEERYNYFQKQIKVPVPTELPGIHRPQAGPSKELQSETQTVDESDLASTTLKNKPATSYREQAKHHLKKRKECYQKARQCVNSNDRQLANFYFGLARQHTQFYEQANEQAAEAFIVENRERNPAKNTIDLHYLYVREAIPWLDKCLDDEILSLRDESKQTKILKVVTGRGKHSPDGIPKIKPAVIVRLEDRGLKYSELNPGLLRVQIFKHSDLTDELT